MKIGRNRPLKQRNDESVLQIHTNTTGPGKSMVARKGGEPWGLSAPPKGGLHNVCLNYLRFSWIISPPVHV